MSRASRQRTFAGMGNQASRRRPLRFVVGYDGSLAAHNAIRYAAQRAGKRGHLSIVHAYDGNTAETSAEALLEAILLEGDDELLDTRYSTYAVHGGAAEALIAAAERDRADEIVIGTRGRGRLESALLGSVGQAVIRDADRPVVVVPGR
jgi:nucleotide-binding universal stress UspA family protein